MTETRRIGWTRRLAELAGLKPSEHRLLELCSPNAPLMREMMHRAPGTYGHSVLTGTLAETAAEAIGASPLLARAGAYYHDIGKMSRPDYFVENVAGGPDPHEHATPEMSAAIITAHVTEGAELAAREGLPGEVVDIIREHHGDSIVRYFYEKARSAGEAVEDRFRYAGERPRTREAALVMLADSVEAAVRSLDRPTGPLIETTVRRIVARRAADGQLGESGMSADDVEVAATTYARVLAGIHHSRIEYPDDKEPVCESA